MSTGIRVLRALTILSGYCEPEKLELIPEHDEVWIGHEIPPEKLSEEDRKRMEELRFRWDAGIPAWHGFV